MLLSTSCHDVMRGWCLPHDDSPGRVLRRGGTARKTGGNFPQKMQSCSRHIDLSRKEEFFKYPHTKEFILKSHTDSLYGRNSTMITEILSTREIRRSNLLLLHRFPLPSFHPQEGARWLSQIHVYYHVSPWVNSKSDHKVLLHSLRQPPKVDCCIDE